MELSIKIFLSKNLVSHVPLQHHIYIGEEKNKKITTNVSKPSIKLHIIYQFIYWGTNIRWYEALHDNLMVHNLHIRIKSIQIT